MKIPTNISTNNTSIDSDRVKRLLLETVARIDCSTLGIAVGTVVSIAIFAATNFLVLKGGANVGPTLSLLNHYFAGFSVSLAGSFIGMIYGFVCGFLLGWVIAFLRNSLVKVYLHYIKFKGRVEAVNNFLDS